MGSNRTVGNVLLLMCSLVQHFITTHTSPLAGFCDRLAPCGLGGVVEEAHLISWPSVVRGN